MISTRQIVRDTLDAVKPYLQAFAEQRLGKKIRNRHRTKPSMFGGDGEPDIQAILDSYLRHWNDLFSEVLSNADRSLVFELKDVRNAWAHEQELSLDDAYRAVDSAQRLLRSVGVQQMPERLDDLKQRIRLRQLPSAQEEVGPNVSRPRMREDPARGAGSLGKKGAELRGKTLRVAPSILKEGNPRRPYTHGWLAFEVLLRAERGTLPFEEYGERLFNPAPEVKELAKAIPGEPDAYQDLKHIRHDIARRRVYVE